MDIEPGRRRAPRALAPRRGAGATIAAVRGFIAEAGLAPGARLPAERALAVALGVSRARLRAALGHMAARGEVWRHVGQGTFLARPVAQPRGTFACLSE